MHLDPEKAEALNALAKHLGIKRSVLMREAIDDLLARHSKKSAKAKRPARK